MKRKANLNKSPGKLPGESDYEYMMRTIQETNLIILENSQKILENSKLLAKQLRDWEKKEQKVAEEREKLECLSNCGTCHLKHTCLLQQFTEDFKSQWCQYGPFPSVSFSVKNPSIQIPEGGARWEDRLSEFLFVANDEYLLTVLDSYTLPVNEFTIINPN